MRLNRTHCDLYSDTRYARLGILPGDCTKPVNGRFHRTPCNRICKHYDDTAYKLKRALERAPK